MQSIKEKKLLVKFAQSMGQPVDPAMVEEVRKYEELQEQIKSSVKTSAFEMFQQAPQPAPLVEQAPTVAPATQTEVLQESDLVTRAAKSIKAPVTEADSFQQPSVPAPTDIKAIKDKVKFLEQWLGKISATGPGSGETRFEFLDDVQRNTVKVDGNFIKYDSSVGKWIGVNTTSGCFHKLANITAASADTIYAFDWYTDTTAHVGNQGITVSSSNPTRISLSQPGNYKIFLEILIKSTVNQNIDAFLWLAKNGDDISESGVKVEIKQGGGDGNYQLASKQWYIDNIAQNDYIELRFAVSDEDGISLEYTGAQTSPYLRPAIPSATITITTSL